jgi:hypothetical protein
MAKKIMGISKDSILSTAKLTLDRATLVFYGSLAIFRCFIIMILCSAGVCLASDFASVVISPQYPFGTGLYDDPNAVLGEPTGYMIDDFGKRFACSLVYGAWNKSWPDGKKTVVTLSAGRTVIVGFDHKVADDVQNPYGIDFIVFGNTAFNLGGYVYCNTDMEQVWLPNPVDVLVYEPVTVSVAQYPNGPWYSFSEGPYADADLFPTNSFAWEGLNIGGDGCANWGEESDPLKSMDPNLTWEDFDGISVPGAIALYEGSAGGTGFDLQWLAPADYEALEPDPQSGRRWIQYIKFSSATGEVDAVSDVAACGDYQHPFVPGDINQDCRVDLADFMVLAENWLVCTWNCEP